MSMEYLKLCLQARPDLYPVCRMGIGWFRDSAFGLAELEAPPGYRELQLSVSARRVDRPWRRAS